MPLSEYDQSGEKPDELITSIVRACEEQPSNTTEDLGSGDEVAIGQWYWVKDIDKTWNSERKAYDEKSYEWLGCIMSIGTNYVELESPHSDRGYHSDRVHMDAFFEKLRLEPNPESVIRGYIRKHQQRLTSRINEVKALAAELGVSANLSIAAKKSDSPGTALAVMSGHRDIKEYESDLKKAEKKTLPALFEAIKEENRQLAKWTGAETLPMLAQSKALNGVIGSIQDRVFNISLYAGLIEQVVQCRDGEPAAFHEKLRVMQRLLYMDEECLLDYQLGGMCFKKIAEFDAWLSKKDNFERILPFQRCMVAMRVRRHVKHREWDGTIGGIMMNIAEAQSDKWTFLFIRNGERLYRLGSDSFEFDGLEGMIFPDKALFDPSEPMMIKTNWMSSSSERGTMSVAQYEEMCREQDEAEQNSLDWEKKNPLEEWLKAHPEHSDSTDHMKNYMWGYNNPFKEVHSSFNRAHWEPFNDSSVYYDDYVNEMAERIKKYNRIALLIQGLFDRSDVLHPHPPVKTWQPDNFAACIELVYDGSANLYDGPEPDIDAFIAKCNASLNADSVVIGQQIFWEELEAEKENQRRMNDWRDTNKHEVVRWKPHGNPGPGYVAKMAEFKPRAGKAVFCWNRKRLTGDRWSGKRYGDPLPTQVTVPVEKLFNVSGYTPGEYKQFFKDPRTREKYLRWAPLLLAAEEYHAGNVKLGATEGD